MFIIGNLFRMCFLLKSNWILDKYRRVECSVYHRLCPEVAMKMLGLIQQRAGRREECGNKNTFFGNWEADGGVLSGLSAPGTPHSKPEMKWVAGHGIMDALVSTVKISGHNM